MNKTIRPPAGLHEEQIEFKGWMEESAPKADARRRALLKGSAAAVPVIMTLRSGAAIAEGSGGACLAAVRGSASTERPAPYVSTNDTYLRTAIALITKGNLSRVEPKSGGGFKFPSQASNSPYDIYQTNPANQIWWSVLIGASLGTLPQAFTLVGSFGGSTVTGASGGPKTGTVFSAGSVPTYYFYEGDASQLTKSSYGLVVTDEWGSIVYTDSSKTTQAVGYYSNYASANTPSCYSSINP